MLSTQYRLRLEGICKKIALQEQVSLEEMVWAEKLAKAKNRLANMMGNNTICIVEQDKGDGMVFLASENKKYFFWVNVSNDCHWETEWEVL